MCSASSSYIYWYTKYTFEKYSTSVHVCDVSIFHIYFPGIKIIMYLTFIASHYTLYVVPHPTPCFQFGRKDFPFFYSDLKSCYIYSICMLCLFSSWQRIGWILKFLIIFQTNNEYFKFSIPEKKNNPWVI